MSGQRFDVPQPCLARYLEDRGNFIGQDPPLCARCTVGMEMVCSVYGRNELPSFALNGAPVLNSSTLFLSPCLSRKIYACIHFPFSVTIRERRKEGKKRKKKRRKEGCRDSGRCSPPSGSRVNSRDSVFFLVRSLHSRSGVSPIGFGRVAAHRYIVQLYNLVSILSLCYRNERDPFIARATRFLRTRALRSNACSELHVRRSQMCHKCLRLRDKGFDALCANVH